MLFDPDKNASSMRWCWWFAYTGGTQSKSRYTRKETHGERPHKEKGIRRPYPRAHHIQANVKRGTNTSDGVSTMGVRRYTLPSGRFCAENCYEVALSPDYKQLNIITHHCELYYFQIETVLKIHVE